jgi:hypothetical protein
MKFIAYAVASAALLKAAAMVRRALGAYGIPGEQRHG